MFTEILLLGATLLAPADSTPRKTLAAHRLAPGEAAPVLDGRLDDAAWAQAPVATGFVQSKPHAGQPATERTEARVAVRRRARSTWPCAHTTRTPTPSPRSWGVATRAASTADWLHVVLDSYHDRRTGVPLFA